ncbi:MAG: restriction endonuclease subunit S [Acidobacteria bacterium]|nr:restriction endonuclease subunit S [Acidobacteriota bacterium]MBI3422934.1 restriction endonuclease subunit S [Acidobacteriota bacterium]
MKAGWQRKKVSEIAQHSLGKMLDKAKNKGEPKPYLRNLNVRWFGFDLSDVSEMRFLPEETAKYTAIKGDLLICEGGYPGRAAIWDQDEPIYFQKALHRVRFYQAEHSKWMLYYLYACDLDGTLKQHFNGAGIQHFTGETLSQFEIPLPPLSEQQRIVGILDEAFDGIGTAKANAEQNRQNARALFESHLQSVFTMRGEGWVEKRLGDLCERITKGSSPKWQGIDYVEKPGVLFVTSENVGEYQLLMTKPKYVEEKFNAKDKKSILQKGDVLTNIVGASIGRTAIFDLEEIANINQAVCLIRCEPMLLSNFYLTYLLNSPVFRDILHDNEVDSARANLSLGFFSQLTVPLPPLPAQRDVVAKLDALREETQRLESIYQQKLAALDELKKSLLHQAFTGEL